MNSRFRPIYLTLLVALGGLLPMAASAATTQSFQISPPTANYPADPGADVQGKIKVTNLSDVAIELKVGKQNFVAKGEEGEIELVDNANPLYSLAPWFTPAADTIQVPARGTKEIGYSIAVPAGAEPGGRYGSIVFSSVPPKLPSGVSGATVQQTLAGVVFLRINGAANEQLTVASFQTGKAKTGPKPAANVFSPATFFETGPIDLMTRVKNTGSVHEKPVGTITIKNMFGFTVAKIPLDEHYVIPGAIRRLHNTWAPKGPIPLIGRYTAEVAGTYAGGKTLAAKTTFTVVPYKLLAAVLIGLILLVVIVRKGRKRLGRAARILAGRE